jgi:hypothetical protein
MPRPGPRRELVALRLLPDAIEHLDQRAEAEQLHDEQGRPNRSEMIRVMLAYASAHMPAGWRPG